MKFGIAAALVVAVGTAALAQHAGHRHAPYAGMHNRDIKALSDQQIADLRAGRGMGYALAAELNGYPGPLHVIELADQLGLDPAPRAKIRELFESMKAEAIPAGELLIEREAALDRAFADKTMSPEALAALTARSAEAQGQLRQVHLKYHLTTADLLTPHQRHRYAQLRGYR
jgi:Spy/CpxP family protein refolding chaperone